MDHFDEVLVGHIIAANSHTPHSQTSNTEANEPFLALHLAAGCRRSNEAQTITGSQGGKGRECVPGLGLDFPAGLELKYRNGLRVYGTWVPSRPTPYIQCCR